MDNEEAKRRRLASALDFNSDGLVLVPMHPVIGGVCQGAHEIAPGEYRRGGTCTHKPGKHPAGKWSRYRDAGPPNHLQDLLKWVGRDQNLGVLMDCGTLRIWVADCDTPAAREYVESIIGKTPCVVETGRDGGGWHLYYLLPAGVSMKTDNGKSFPGLDIKTSGYVIAPWGRHHSGRYYTPCDGFDLELAPIADPHTLKPVLAPSVPIGGAAAANGTATPKVKQLRVPREEPRWYYYGQRRGKMYDATYLYQMARKWLFRQGGCIQGQRGRRRLFRLTCELVRWYLLDADQTLSLLTEFNVFNSPPFSTPELSDAVDAAFVLGTWSVRGQMSYRKAHAREKGKSVKSTKRRSDLRTEERQELRVELREFLRACCTREDQHKATVTDLWSAFCDYAPWVASDQRARFGAILGGVLLDVFRSAERKRGQKGYYYSGVRLRSNYMEHCAHAA
jgi:hypothetical protein